MKLKYLIDMNNSINELSNVLMELEDDFLKQLDDDMFSIDLRTCPEWKDGYNVIFTSVNSLTKKFLIRFCEDYGLSLKDYMESDEGFVYTFKVEEDDIIESINKIK